jgi:hypothetical protein
VEPTEAPPTLRIVALTIIAAVGGAIGILVASMLFATAGPNSAQAWPFWLLLAGVLTLSLAELAFAWGTWMKKPLAMRPKSQVLGFFFAVAVICVSLLFLVFSVLLAQSFGA